MANSTQIERLPDCEELREVGAYMSGWKQEDIVKTRAGNDGTGLVVVNVRGEKKSFDEGQYQTALRDAGKGILRGKSGKFVSLEQQDADHRAELRKKAKPARRLLRSDNE